MMKKILLFTLLFSSFLIKAQSKIYTETEIDSKAYFPGGWNNWIEFVEKNFNWAPEKNAKNVSIEFTVQTDGSVTYVKILKPVGSPNEKEALRVMALSPKWLPATKKEKAVSCRLSRGMFNPYFDNENSGFGAITISESKRDLTPIESLNQDDNNIYNFAGIEIKPEFSGGMQKFYDFFFNNFKMPNEEDLQGKIFITFIVEKDGALSGIKTIRDIGFDTGIEAVRVLKISPKWIPGMQNGKRIRVNYSLNISIGSN